MAKKAPVPAQPKKEAALTHVKTLDELINEYGMQDELARINAGDWAMPSMSFSEEFVPMFQLQELSAMPSQPAATKTQPQQLNTMQPPSLPGNVLQP